MMSQAKVNLAASREAAKNPTTTLAESPEITKAKTMVEKIKQAIMGQTDIQAKMDALMGSPTDPKGGIFKP